MAPKPSVTVPYGEFPEEKVWFVVRRYKVCKSCGGQMNEEEAVVRSGDLILWSVNPPGGATGLCVATVMFGDYDQASVPLGEVYRKRRDAVQIGLPKVLSEMEEERAAMQRMIDGKHQSWEKSE